MNRFNVILFAASALWISGCAMMFRGSSQPIALSSSPDGATATVDDGVVNCITPCTLDLSRKENHTVKFHKDGFQDASMALSSSTSAWLLGDAVIWGPFALLDFTNGAAYSLSDDSLKVTLLPMPAGSQATAGIPKSVRPSMNAASQAATPPTESSSAADVKTVKH